MTSEEIILSEVIKSGTSNPMQYVRNITKKLDMINLNQLISSCSECKKPCKKSFAHGNHNASVMVIGEYQTIENKTDKILPFKPMDMLSKVLELNNINQEDVFYINSVSCSPYKEYGNEIEQSIPGRKEVENCKYFVEYAIEFVQPEIIFLMGAIPLNMFKTTSSDAVRGTWLNVKGVPAMPTYNPLDLYNYRIKGVEEDILLEKEDAFITHVTKALMYLKKKRPNLKLFNGDLFDLDIL